MPIKSAVELVFTFIKVVTVHSGRWRLHIEQGLPDLGGEQVGSLVLNVHVELEVLLVQINFLDLTVVLLEFLERALELEDFLQGNFREELRLVERIALVLQFLPLHLGQQVQVPFD